MPGQFMEAMFETIEIHNKWNNCSLHVKLLSLIRNETYSIHCILSYMQVLSLLRQIDSKAVRSLSQRQLSTLHTPPHHNTRGHTAQGG